MTPEAMKALLARVLLRRAGAQAERARAGTHRVTNPSTGLTGLEMTGEAAIAARLAATLAGIAGELEEDPL